MKVNFYNTKRGWRWGTYFPTQSAAFFYIGLAARLGLVVEW